eukprot:1348736-Amorphochlora_amoeboformis.AAC.2
MITGHASAHLGHCYHCGANGGGSWSELRAGDPGGFRISVITRDSCVTRAPIFPRDSPVVSGRKWYPTQGWDRAIVVHAVVVRLR